MERNNHNYNRDYSFSSKWVTIDLRIGKMQHFALRYDPYGLGYGSGAPVICIALSFIMLFVSFPIFAKNPQTIQHGSKTYGFSFYDNIAPQWLPECLTIWLGNSSKTFMMPWHLRMFDTSYETRVASKMHVKSLSQSKAKTLMKNTASISIDVGSGKHEIAECSYWRQTKTYKHCLLGIVIDKWQVKKMTLEVECTINGDKHSSSMESSPDETATQAFNRWCDENNASKLT